MKRIERMRLPRGIRDNLESDDWDSPRRWAARLGTIGLSDTDVQSALIDAYHAGVDRDALRFVTIALLNRCAPVGQSWNDDRGYEG